MMAPDFPVLQGCPWSSLIERFPPNVKWCEAPLCSWISEPANTWSNVAYLLVGLWILGRTRGEPIRRAFGLAALCVGSCSFVYHASTNFILQLVDFMGMYIYILLPLLLNLHRLGALRRALPLPLYAGGVAALLGLTLLVRAAGLPIQAIVLVLVLSVLLTELLLSRRSTPAPVDRGSFFLAMGLLTLGSVCSALDVKRIWCDPQDHVLQGHAAWHVLSALALLATSRFYGRLRLQLR